MDSSGCIGKYLPEMVGRVEAAIRAAESGLWHEATLLLFRIVETRSPSVEYACHIYDSLLTPDGGAVYMSPLFYASIVLQLSAGIGEAGRMRLLQNAIAAQKGGTAESMEAKLSLQCGVALFLLVNTAEMDSARSTVRDIQIYLETRDARPVPPLLSVQNNLLTLELSWMNGDFDAVAHSGMSLYAHRNTKWTAHIDELEKIWAKTALAMLLNPEVIDFGELLQKKPMLDALNLSSPRAYELVVCMDQGNTLRACEIINTDIDFTHTDGNIRVLREKVLLASFLRYVRRSPNEKRAFSFSEITEVCGCKPESVEMLLLNALERRFVMGKIDGRNEIFLLENIQPGHIPLDEVHSLDASLKNLIASVAQCKTFLETQ